MPPVPPAIPQHTSTSSSIGSWLTSPFTAAASAINSLTTSNVRDLPPTALQRASSSSGGHARPQFHKPSRKSTPGGIVGGASSEGGLRTPSSTTTREISRRHSFGSGNTLADMSAGESGASGTPALTPPSAAISSGPSTPSHHSFAESAPAPAGPALPTYVVQTPGEIARYNAAMLAASTAAASAQLPAGPPQHEQMRSYSTGASKEPAMEHAGSMAHSMEETIYGDDSTFHRPPAGAYSHSHVRPAAASASVLSNTASNRVSRRASFDTLEDEASASTRARLQHQMVLTAPPPVYGVESPDALPTGSPEARLPQSPWQQEISSTGERPAASASATMPFAATVQSAITAAPIVQSRSQPFPSAAVPDPQPSSSAPALPTMPSQPDLSSYSSANVHARGSSSSSGIFGLGSGSVDGEDGNGSDVEAAASPLLPGLADLVPSFFGMRSSSSASAIGNSNSSSNTSASLQPSSESPSPPLAPRNVKLLNFQRVLSDSQVDLAALRRMSWNGIPSAYRALTWKLLLGYLPILHSRRAATLHKRREEYAGYLREFYFMGREKEEYEEEKVQRSELEHEYLKQIRQDVPRTSPAIKFFKDPPVQRSLERILYLFAVRHPASGYVQGINDLATPFWTVFARELYDLDILTTDTSPLTEGQYTALEADTFWCMSYLIDGIQDHYTFAQPGIQRMVYRLKELILRIDGNTHTTTTATGTTPAWKGRNISADSHVGLHEHFERENVQFLHFAFRWMSCLLMRELKLSLILRLWDAYLSEDAGFASGFKVFHVYVCAAFLMRWKEELKRMDFQQLIQFLQKLPTEDWTEQEIESLLATAHVYRELFHASPQHLA